MRLVWVTERKQEKGRGRVKRRKGRWGGKERETGDREKRKERGEEGFEGLAGTEDTVKVSTVMQTSISNTEKLKHIR